MARFDYEVCEDLVEGGYCGGERGVGVAEGGEEGGDWVGVLVGWWVVSGDLGDLRSSLLKTWPFWRTRARGSAMVSMRFVGFFRGGGGWCCD